MTKKTPQHRITAPTAHRRLMAEQELLKGAIPEDGAVSTKPTSWRDEWQRRQDALDEALQLAEKALEHSGGDKAIRRSAEVIIQYHTDMTNMLLQAKKLTSNYVIDRGGDGMTKFTSLFDPADVRKSIDVYQSHVDALNRRVDKQGKKLGYITRIRDAWNAADAKSNER